MNHVSIHTMSTTSLYDSCSVTCLPFHWKAQCSPNAIRRQSFPNWSQKPHPLSPTREGESCVDCKNGKPYLLLFVVLNEKSFWFIAGSWAHVKRFLSPVNKTISISIFQFSSFFFQIKIAFPQQITTFKPGSKRQFQSRTYSLFIRRASTYRSTNLFRT